MTSSDPTKKSAEGGYGSPTPEDEMPPGESAQARSATHPQDQDANDPPPANVPSADAPLDDSNTEATAPGRESFSSESRVDAAGDS